jgi:1-acyl-sn-glycerol-3-phosphate acyltransferase
MCLWLLSLFGWRTVFAGFPGPKGVVVVYPHTSNWDFVVGMLYRLGYGLSAHWLAKHSLFRWPFAGLLRRLGGIPVDRRAPQGAIVAIAEEFERRDFMWLAVTPEGTRSYTDHWKSGFYQIALAADVPCALGYIDYRGKTVGIDTFLSFEGDAAQDMAKVQAFYSDKQALHPEKASRIRLRARASPPPGEPAIASPAARTGTRAAERQIEGE